MVTVKVPPSPENTFALLVTYHPGEETVLALRTLPAQVEHIIIIDNASPGSAMAPLQREMQKNPNNFTICLNRTNVGVAAGLNQGARISLERGAEWLLALDQDSCPLPSLFATLQNAWLSCAFRKMAAIVGSQSNNRVEAFVTPPYKEVTTVITSGSLINLAIWKSVGGFREDFFIDAVDEEFCLRLQRRGYRVIQATRPGIRHVVGRPSTHRLFGRTLTTTNHSPSRRYYMARNRIRLALEYVSEHPQWIRKYFFYSLKDFSRMLLLEKDRLRKLCAALIGIRDAFGGRMGKLRNAWLARDDIE